MPWTAKCFLKAGIIHAISAKSNEVTCGFCGSLCMCVCVCTLHPSTQTQHIFLPIPSPNISTSLGAFSFSFRVVCQRPFCSGPCRLPFLHISLPRSPVTLHRVQRGLQKTCAQAKWHVCNQKEALHWGIWHKLLAQHFHDHPIVISYWSTLSREELWSVFLCIDLLFCWSFDLCGYQKPTDYRCNATDSWFHPFCNSFKCSCWSISVRTPFITAALWLLWFCRITNQATMLAVCLCAASALTYLVLVNICVCLSH